MIATILMVASAAVLLLLGTLHLIYTFVGSKLRPRDPALQLRMAEVPPGISRQTTMWRSWIGFNISHSMAAILFALIYGYLPIAHADLLFASPYLLSVGLLMLVGLLVVAKRYWFSAPFIGIAVSLVCYLGSVVTVLN